MASSSKGVSQNINEEQRLATYLEQRKEAHQKSVRELESEQGTEIQKLSQRYKEQKKAIEEDYKVSISSESKEHAEKLERLRKSNSNEIKSEKDQFEKEFNAVREREQKRIADYQKKQAQNLEKIHERFVNAR